MKANVRMALSIFWVMLGAALIVLSLLAVIDSGMYSGMGGALIAVGVIQIVRQIRYRKSADYREKVDTEMHDERNRYIRMKAWSWAGYLFVLCTAVSGIVCYVMGKNGTGQLLTGVMCLMVVLYSACYIILSRKY